MVAPAAFCGGSTLLTLVAASVVGRSLRFFLVAALLFFFGPPVKRLIDRYFEWFALAFGALLVAGFAAIKWAT